MLLGFVYKIDGYTKAEQLGTKTPATTPAQPKGICLPLALSQHILLIAVSIRVSSRFQRLRRTAQSVSIIEEFTAIGNVFSTF